MTTKRNVLIGLFAAASLGAVAAESLAQPPQGFGARRGPPGADARGPASPEQRAQNLRQRLSITPAQENAFAAYLSATGAPQRPAMQGRRGGPVQGMTAPQRLDAQLAQAAERQADLKARAEAAKRFYAVLSPEQRAVFDALPPQAMLGMAPGGGGARMAMGPRGGGREGRGPGRGRGGYQPQ